MRYSSRYRSIAWSTVAALWLTACGGGGGGDAEAPPPPPAPAPAPEPPPPPPPPPPPAPAPSSVQITELAQQALPDTSYEVAATTAGTVVITLPDSAQIQPGQTVSVTGTSANNWQIAQNAGQTILTTGMAGNALPGARWTPHLTPQAWHWLSSNAAGNVLVAGEGFGPEGNLHTSVDGGATWSIGDSPVGPTWISSDMSASGDRIVAVQYGGGMYTSTTFGATWTPVTSANPAVTLSGQPFESVTVSQSGQRIVTTVQNGPVYAFDGQNWVVGTAGGVALNEPWRSVDSSRSTDPLTDGMIVMAASQDGDIFRSTDGGQTWLPRSVVVGGVTVFENWYRIKMSDDGNVIVVVANSFGGVSGTGIYVSPDAGVTWTKAHSLAADYTAIAMSGNGQVIGVTVSGATGGVLASTDGGATFAPVTALETSTNWRAIAMSSDGNKIAVAAGLFVGSVPGQLYTSLGNRTEAGASGSVTGAQGQSAVFEYVGNGQYKVQSSSGTFTIQ